MGIFLELEKIRYTTPIPHNSIFSEKVKTSGLYKGKQRPYCLPQIYSDENLFEGIRERAKEYFKQYEIKWHDSINRKPSNHQCNFQVACNVECIANFISGSKRRSLFGF